jgi:hypothetical protein
MSQDAYRITSPALSLFLDKGSQISRMVPKDSVITTDSKTFNGDKLVQVVLNGSVVMMFTQDLRSRGEKIKPRITRITRIQNQKIPVSA